jgi:hypothetical protein
MMKILEFSSGHVIVNNIRNKNRNNNINNKNDIKSRQCPRRCRGKHHDYKTIIKFVYLMTLLVSQTV